MNKNLARFAAAGLLVAALSACSFPGLSNSGEIRPVSSQSQPAQSQPAQSQPAQSQPAPDQPAANQTAPGTSSASSKKATVSIDGVSYTCAELVGLADGCGEYLEPAFELYGGGIDGFVNSGRLGVFSTSQYSYSDAAMAGLMACTYRLDESNAYVEVMQAGYPLTSNELTPVFFEAHLDLCP
jgi:hypothetical protein